MIQREKLGNLLTESKILSENPNANRRITVRLNVKGLEKRPFENEIAGATKQYVRKAGQFIYGKQNFHKGAFGIIPPELDNYESSSDLPSFDVSKNCLPEWIYYYFKTGNRYLELEKIARGVGSKRIHSEQLSEIEIPLPDIPTQKKIINELKKDELKHSKLKSEISHQQSLLKKLRQAILQEAVQGKLVKQDKNDEPASELLKRIKAEKQKLIVEGKLRKEKPLPPIKEEEIPFALPKGWAWCRFGDISSVVRGGSPRPAGSKQFYDGNIPFLKVGDLTADEKIYLDTHTFTIKEAGLTKTRMVQENTLMLTNSGATLGVPKICRFKTTFNDGIAAFLNIDTRLSKEFLYFLLKSKTGWYLKEASRGQGQPNLNTDIIKNTLIAFPPSDEQLRIVGKINSLFLFCDQLEKQIEENVKHSEFLLQAVLKEAFEGKE